MNELLKRLKDLGLKIETASEIRYDPKDKIKLDTHINGTWIESQGQKIFIVKKVYPYGSKHGQIELDNSEGYLTLASFWKIKDIHTFQLKDFIFIDTETSSLSIGAGALIFLFGSCFFTEAGVEVLQIFIEDPSNEAFFLSYIDNLLIKYKCLVTYNGKSFDLPILKTRFILNRLENPIEKFAHIDLLYYSRRIWKYRLDSKRLSDIENRILEFERSEEEVPGWLIPQIYQDYLQSGSAESLKGVFYHNEIDVVSLAALFQNLNQMLISGDITGLESLSLGEIYRKSRQYEKADNYFKYALNKDSDTQFQEKIYLNLGYSLKKQQKWEEAIPFWENASKKNNIEACIELAKYYEHISKEIIKAIKWTQKAIAISKKRKIDNVELIGELEYRLNRLKRKTGRSDGK